MASQEKTITKKLGRPATGLGTLIGVRLQPSDLDALDALIASRLPGEKLSRPEAIRQIVRTTLQLTKGQHEGTK